MSTIRRTTFLFLLTLGSVFVDGFPSGKWDFHMTGGMSVNLSRPMFKDAQIFTRVTCESNDHDSDIDVGLMILTSRCLNATDSLEMATSVLRSGQFVGNISNTYYFKRQFKCGEVVNLKEATLEKDEKSLKPDAHPIFKTAHDGIYAMALIIGSDGNTTLGIHIELMNTYGYLAASDWPKWPFYGFMCFFYVILGIIWLVLSFLQWREVLRVQFWIGGVILMGMIENATYYAEYQSTNHTGMEDQGVMLFAGFVSCVKRTLARILVVIVSLGFGIVKPRLGSTLHRVVGVGFLYFVLAASDKYLKTVHRASDSSRELVIAQVPLAVLDSAICWWIFSALVNTTRTLRLRRNEVKLSLYRHFTNTLIFAVLASVCFMLYSIKVHHPDGCLTVWKDLWLDESFWDILFSALLLVIMILWRPTNNNQRYAFVPLLDTGEDEEEEQLVNDAYGVKVRVHRSSSKNEAKSHHAKGNNSVDDDLKWLEENVIGDPTLPILDAEEEMINTRFEVSKMQ